MARSKTIALSNSVGLRPDRSKICPVDHVRLDGFHSVAELWSLDHAVFGIEFILL